VRGDLYLATDIRLGTLNSVWLFGDDPDRAEREAATAAAAWARNSIHVQDFLALQALCNIDLYRGDPERAHERVSQSWHALSRSPLFRVQLIRSQCLLMRARAAVALAAAQNGRAGERALTAVALHALGRADKERVPAVAGQALLLRASLRAGAGDASGATGLLGSAVRVFQAEGLELMAACAQLALAQVAGSSLARESALAAERYFTAQAIRHPARVAAFIAPGLLS
jgi:hypothetical protein